MRDAMVWEMRSNTFASDISSCWFEQRAATLSLSRVIFLISQEASRTPIIHKSVEQGVGDALTFDWPGRR
jgi:hypothetical protein